MFIASRQEVIASDLYVTYNKTSGHADIVARHNGFYILIDSVSDADALIAAACEAKRLLTEAAAQCANCDQPLNGREIRCISAGCPSRPAAPTDALPPGDIPAGTSASVRM